MASSSVFGIMERGDTTEEKTISKWEYEYNMARMDMINKRLWILVIILLLMLFITNGSWYLYERQFEVVEETTTRQVITQDVDTGDYVDAVVAGIGDAFNGESKADSAENDNDTEIPQKEEKVIDER